MKHAVLAVVPARGQSKGLPRKNLRLLAGKPLVAYSIEAALQSKLVDAVCVSTEDEEISQVARAYDGVTVVNRPAELATDTAQNNGVVRHAVCTIEKHRHFEHVVLLQPTSPLRSAEHLDECLEGFLASGARSALSVVHAEHHPGKSIVLGANGWAEPFTCLADMEKRRQDLPVVYRQNGAIYALRVEDFLAFDRFYLPPCFAYVMPAEVSVDIDSELDLQIASTVLRSKQCSEAKASAA